MTALLTAKFPSPKEVSTMMEMFYTALSNMVASSQPRVAFGHLKCGYGNWGPRFFILFSFNICKLKQPYMLSDYSIAKI